jgi:Lambda phage tail tape-measure protein (Tape_meas_lam_C)
MALENQIAAYEVQITRTGDGAAVAVQEFKNLDSAAKTVSGSLGASAESLTKMRESSLMARESMHELNSITMLAGGTRFPELTEASIAARMALMSMRTAVQLTGATLETVVPIVGFIVAALGAGAYLWNSYREEMKKVEEQAKSMSDALEKMPALVTEISGLLKAGLISPDQSQQWMQMLGRTPSHAHSEGTLSIAGMNLQTPEVPFRSAGKLSVGGLNLNVPEEHASPLGAVTPDALGDVQKQMRDQGLLDANNRLDPQIEALEKLQTLQKTISSESLEGYAKERDASQKKYEDELAQIQQLALIASQKFSTDQRAALDAAALTANQTRLDAINSKQTAELDKRDAEAKIQLQKLVVENQREADAALKAEQEAFHEESLGMIKNFNLQEKLYTVSSKEDKKTILATELQDRRDFDLNMYEDYRMTLEEMNQADTQAQIKYQEGLNSMQHHEELRTMTMQQMENQAATQFASGFSNAFLEFVQGTKSAGQAFAEFAQSFLADIAKMILQQEMLNVIKSAFFSGGGMAVSGAASGGIFPTFAASGISGVGSLSTPTYFPKFNVVAGEAGTEALTVLARPRMMDIGGMKAVIGQAGSQTLAITNAAALAGGAGGVSGTAVIMIQPAPGYEASIVNNAIQGAVLKVTSDMGQNTALRQAAKQAVS